jgi:hypothetical protein
LLRSAIHLAGPTLGSWLAVPAPYFKFKPEDPSERSSQGELKDCARLENAPEEILVHLDDSVRQSWIQNTWAAVRSRNAHLVLVHEYN